MTTYHQIQDKNHQKTTRTILDNGYMRVTGTAAVVGRYDYPNLGRDKYPETGYRAYVSASELKASMNGLVGMPVTDGHPPVDVDDTNTSKYGKGSVYSVAFDEEAGKLRFEEMITDAALRNKVAANKKIGKSPGYKVTFVPVEDDPEGDKARALGCNVVQRGRIYNHNAVVFDARGGEEARIDDMSDKKLEEILNAVQSVSDKVDGLEAKTDEMEKKIEDFGKEVPGEKPEEGEDEGKKEEVAKDAIEKYREAATVAALLDQEIAYDGDLDKYRRAVCDAFTGDEFKVSDEEIGLTLKLAPRQLRTQDKENFKRSFQSANDGKKPENAPSTLMGLPPIK